MPKPVAHPGAYRPALDGLRALAVIAVIGYHLGIPYFDGGLLGVGVFFTLSGFLITGILLRSWDRTGSFELKKFWIHRARRLVPALVIVLAAVLLFTWLVRPEELGKRLAETWPGLLYISNWTTILAGQSYFDRFAGPGPLDHLWSLAVEEQFYVIWPLLLLLGFAVLKVRRVGMAVITTALTAGSFFLLAVIATPGFDNTRAYEGTDTRAGGLLVGALLAFGWKALSGVLERHFFARFAAQLLGLAGLVGIGWLAVTTTEQSIGLYQHGLVLLSVFTALAVIPAACARTLFGSALGCLPLRWVGERSYGIYLWHLPIVAAVPPTVVEEHPVGWSALIVLATLLVSELSWRWVENPIRQHGFRRALSRVRLRVIPVLPAGVVVVCLLGTLSLVGTSAALPLVRGAATFASRTPSHDPSSPGTKSGTPMSTRSATPSNSVPSASTPSSTTPTPTPTPVSVNGVQQTSCTSVVHIGESTSLGMVDASLLPDPATRLPGQFKKVGVKDVRTDILGARSIVERWKEQPNALDGVETQLKAGYKGCWSIAMGTNDTANVQVGGLVTLNQRIDLIMKAVNGQPVLWMTVKTDNKRGPYANKHMEEWNKTLIAACKRYPNLRVYDWAAEVQTPWFLDDGIHFTKVGYTERSRRIAAGLSQAYPLGMPPAPTCVVRSGLK